MRSPWNQAELNSFRIGYSMNLITHGQNLPDSLHTSTHDLPTSPINSCISDNGGHLSLCSQKSCKETKIFPILCLEYIAWWQELKYQLRVIAYTLTSFICNLKLLAVIYHYAKQTNKNKKRENNKKKTVVTVFTTEQVDLVFPVFVSYCASLTKRATLWNSFTGSIWIVF